MPGTQKIVNSWSGNLLVGWSIIYSTKRRINNICSKDTSNPLKTYLKLLSTSTCCCMGENPVEDTEDTKAGNSDTVKFQGHPPYHSVTKSFWV